MFSNMSLLIVQVKSQAKKRQERLEQQGGSFSGYKDEEPMHSLDVVEARQLSHHAEPGSGIKLASSLIIADDMQIHGHAAMKACMLLQALEQRGCDAFVPEPRYDSQGEDVHHLAVDVITAKPQQPAIGSGDLSCIKHPACDEPYQLLVANEHVHGIGQPLCLARSLRSDRSPAGNAVLGRGALEKRRIVIYGKYFIMEVLQSSIVLWSKASDQHSRSHFSRSITARVRQISLGRAYEVRLVLVVLTNLIFNNIADSTRCWVVGPPKPRVT